MQARQDLIDDLFLHIITLLNKFKQAYNFICTTLLSSYFIVYIPISIEHIPQQPQQAVSLQPFQPGQLRATLTSAHHHHHSQDNQQDVNEGVSVGEAVADEDIGNYVLVELMGDQSGNITVSASGADQQATMDAVVKQLLEDTPNSALHQHLNALTTTNAEGENVVELVLNGPSEGDILMEQQQQQPQSVETTADIPS